MRELRRAHLRRRQQRATTALSSRPPGRRDLQHPPAWFAQRAFCFVRGHMTTYNTGNPLGSQDPRDLFDNAQNLDDAANSQASETWNDRFGKSRKTWHGIEKQAQLDIATAVAEAVEAATVEAEVYRDEAKEARDDAKAAAGAIGPVKFYDTHAQTLADIANIPDDALIEIARDETHASARTRYFKRAGDVLEFAVNLDQLRLDLTQPSGEEPAGGFDSYSKVSNYSGRATRMKVKDATGMCWWVRQGEADGNGGTVLKDALNRSWEREFSGEINGLWFGMVGDDLTDNTDSFLRARTAALGGELFLPAGAYLTDRLLLDGISNLRVVGAGKYITTIKLLSSVSHHLLDIVNSENITLQSIAIDQNSAGKIAGHGIRVGGVDGLNLVDFVIRNCYGYGIGIQAGANKNVFISHFEIYNTGQDGIDVKDFMFANESLRITSGLISEYGLLQSSQTGIDIRGPASVSNIQLKSSAAVGGLRLRHAGGQGRAGSGNFSNIYAELSGSSQAIYTSADCTNFNISDVCAVNCALGVIDGKSGNLSNLTCTNSPGDALSILGKDIDIQGVVIDGAPRAVDFETGATGNSLSRFNFKNISGSVAVRIQGTADYNSLSDGRVESGKSISDSGIGTTISKVKGWKTAVNLLSSDLAVDSIGTRTFVFTHGLAVNPKPEDITLTAVRSTGNASDYRLGMFHLDGSPSATEFVARVYVSTASSTPGAAIKIAATVRAKNS